MTAAAARPADGPTLALFDFDGTLTTRDTLPDFVRASVPRWRLRTGGALLAPWVLGYRRGWVSGVAIRRAIARVGYTGLPADAVAEAGRAFARDALPRVLRPEAMAALDAHRHRGDRVVVVSGGFDVYLAPWCAAQGLELLCSRLEVADDGHLTGRYLGRQCVGDEKARRVRAHLHLADYARVHAWGDSVEDEALLALADHAVYRGVPRAAA